jgi:hypothetical protein
MITIVIPSSYGEGGALPSDLGTAAMLDVGTADNQISTNAMLIDKLTTIFETPTSVGLSSVVRKSEGHGNGINADMVDGKHASDFALTSHTHPDMITTMLWANIQNKPTTFAPSTHDHDWNEIANKPTEFNPAAHSHTWAAITDKPTTFAPSTHNHTWESVTGKPATFPPDPHSHDEFGVASWEGVINKPETFPPDEHVHTWGDITGKPSTFTPSTHTHTQSEVTGLATSLAGKVDKEAGKGLSDQNYTSAEKTKLAGLESSRFRGQYLSVAALEAAQPDPGVGAYANVDGGSGNPVVRYIWDSTNDEWVQQLGVSTQLTAAQIKEEYESNADTNAFTNAEKTKLANIATGATANATDAQLRDRATHTGAQAISTVTGLQSALDAKVNLTSFNWTSLSGKPATFAPSAHMHPWTDITGKPTTYPPSEHTHEEFGAATWAGIVDKPSTFPPSTHAHTWTEITGKPTSFTPSTHTHTWSEVTGKPTTYPPETHTHSEYVNPTWATLSGKPSTFPPDTHSHTWDSITSKPTTFAPSTHSHSWTTITDKPSTFTPATHTHAWGEITDKPTTFTPSTHTHPEMVTTNQILQQIAAELLASGNENVTIAFNEEHQVFYILRAGLT